MRRTAAALLLLALPTCILAGGPRSVNGQGQPMAWPTAGSVVYNPESGDLGLLDNAAARALVAEAFAAWEAGPAGISFSQGALIPHDVNATGFAFSNPAHFQNFYRVDGDGLSPVIFDHDGSIIEAIFGIGARFEILGVGGIDTPIGTDTEITGASIIINGAFYDGVGLPDSPPDVSLPELKAAIVHEIGHFINLDHTVLNHEQALDDNAGNDIYVPSMFPVAVLDEAALADTNPDDELAAMNLYPPGPPTRRIEGSVTFSGVPFQGANVVIRLQTDPLRSAYSLVSGGLFFPCNAGSSCDPCTTACDPGDPPLQGSFAADFFPAGAYRVCVEQIDTRISLSNDTFVGPLATPPILPGPEECFDFAESGTQADDPEDAANVIAGVGPPAHIALDALPSTDPYEPNNTLGTGATLDDLPGGQDTAPGVLGSGDLDVFNVPVTAGQRVRIDVDAAEMGSALDAVVGFYNASGTLVAFSDDAVDPDSHAFSLDPALELVASFTGTAKVVVSSFPDTDQDGAGGGSTGAYWLRVRVDTDSDGDGAPDGEDICPSAANDDPDRDGVCSLVDNCPNVANPAQDAPWKISGPLVSGGSVVAFAMTSDDSRVVYLADQGTDDTFELYSVPVDGGSPVRLNPSFGASAKDVTNFWVTDTTIVYRADQDTDEVFELYSVPITGGAATKISGSMATGGDVLEFQVSPDNSRVVYRADQDVDGIDELYSVPIGGGAVTQLNDPFVAGGSMVDPPAGFSSFLFSADGSRVVYAADQDTLGQIELYSVPVTGGGTTKLNGSLIAAGDVTFFNLDAINARVFFNADAAVDQRFELYSVPLTGGTATKLSGTMPVGSGGVASFRILADGSTIVYRAAQDTVGRNEAYSVPASGGTPVKLNTALVSGGNVTTLLIPIDTSDGSRLVYRADQEVDQRFELYSVPVTGGSVIKVNPTLVTGGSVTATGDIYDSTVIYVADQDTDEQFEVYTASVLGGSVHKISGAMVPGGDFVGASYSSTKVALLQDKDTDGVVEVYGTHFQGGQPLKLNAPLVAGGNVSDFTFTNGLDPGALVYLADQEVDERYELYARPFLLDRDGDVVVDDCDVCPVNADASQTDADGNGEGDACQPCAVGTDPDADAVCGASDNCSHTSNPGQADFDVDGAGDACDADDDNDGLSDAAEADAGTNPLDPDSDNDGLLDGAEVDAGSDPLSSNGRPATVPFGPQRTISTSAAGAFGVSAADLDGDGDLDVLSASEVDDKIAWYQNTDGKGTFGSQQVITTQADRARCVQAADLDGDGDLDVLSASLDDGKVAWYENLNGLGTFGAQQVIATLAGAESLVTADVDRDGRLDVVVAGSAAWEIGWYRNLGAGTFGIKQSIDANAPAVRSLVVADLDGDGDGDVVAATPSDGRIGWYANDGSGIFGSRQIIRESLPSVWVVTTGDLDGDGDMDVLSTSWTEDPAKVSWYENDGTPGGLGDWTVHELSAPSDGLGAGSLTAADLDGDGDQDVLVVRFGKLVWYENLDGQGAFAPRQQIISTVINNYSGDGMCAGDMDGDGDIDVVTAESDNLAPSNEVSWFENTTLHRNAAFAAPATIGNGASPFHAIAADIDGDGVRDVVTASANSDRVTWLENDGAQPAGFTSRTITTSADGVEFVAATDLDGDGDVDVLSASFNDDKVAWYENNGASPPVWTERSVTTTADGVWWVGAVDLDRDGDVDVLSASYQDSTVAWYENDGASPPGWTKRVITSSVATRRCSIADLDGDGDLDVVAPRIGPGTIVWLRNDGGLPMVWTTHTLVPTGIGTPNAVTTADLDRDGDVDVVASASADTLLAWYENSGAPSPTWTLHTIPRSSTGWFPVSPGDLDGDGDVDLLSGANNVVVWSENDGGNPPAFTDHVLANPGSANSVEPADMDGDGDVDILAVGRVSGGATDTFLLYENRGGQFGLDTVSSAPASMTDGTSAAVLRIDLTSHGRDGDSAVELAALHLGVTDASGASLSSQEGNSLLDSVRLYLDSGSGTFEAASDLLVTSAETLALAPQTLAFVHGDPRVRVEAGTTKRFFVVAQTARQASTHSPNAFRIVHLTASGSSARAVSTELPVSMRFAADLSTATITCNGDVTRPAVTTVYPPNAAVDVSRSTSVVLAFNETLDPSTAAAGVTLSKDGVKVRSMVRVRGNVISIDPEQVLALSSDYQVQVSTVLKDSAGNAAFPFLSTFDTVDDAGAAVVGASQIGEEAGGAALAGANADENSGVAVAALGDVNATAASTGLADLLIGAPNADAGAPDAGKVTLVFGSTNLQSNDTGVVGLTYRTAVAQEHVGETVARAGDLDGDTVQDFLIGAPHSDAASVDAGAVYLVFGDPGLDELAPTTLDLTALPTCAVPTLCGVRFLGAAAGELAGASLSNAGDVNGDGHDDILIGAPEASPGGRAQAGSVYLVYGPLAAGTLSLSQVGVTVAGLVLRGESAGDRFGTSVSVWPDDGGDGFDDLLIGAPGATALDPQGVPIAGAGYVYAIQGSERPGCLDDTLTPGVIEMSRVANGGADQVAGMVFLGAAAGMSLGRSLTGTVDLDGNGVNDVLIAGNGVVFAIPGDGPKVVIGSTTTGGTQSGGGLRAGILEAAQDFGAVAYVTGDDEPLTVGPAGDLDNDGLEDFIIGAPLADTGAGADAGRAYIIFGTPASGEAVQDLSGVGSDIPGIVVEGAAAGDQLGATVGGGFDLNGDGVDDGLVGAPFADAGAGTPDSGETYVLSPLRPDEVVSLGLSKMAGDTVRLEWSVPDLAVTYNVYRGVIATVRAAGAVLTSDMVQLACSTTADADGDTLPDRDDPDATPTNIAWFYLVTAENAQGEGPLGPPGNVPARMNDQQCP